MYFTDSIIPTGKGSVRGDCTVAQNTSSYIFMCLSIVWSLYGSLISPHLCLKGMQIRNWPSPLERNLPSGIRYAV